MSQNEQIDVQETDTEVDTELDTTEASEVDDSNEEDTTSDDEITYEQALAWKKSLEKANKKIAMMEKSKKEVQKDSPKEDIKNLSEDELDLLLEKRDFYKSNPSAKQFREELEAMVIASKWKIDREKAFSLLSWDAEVEENRKVYAKWTVLGWKSNQTGFTPVTLDKFDAMSSKEQSEYLDKYNKFGKGKEQFK